MTYCEGVDRLIEIEKNLPDIKHIDLMWLINSVKLHREEMGNLNKQIHDLKIDFSSHVSDSEDIIEKLKEDIEKERMCLAACDLATCLDTVESVNDFSVDDKYKSHSLESVLKCVRSKVLLEEELRRYAFC